MVPLDRYVFSWDIAVQFGYGCTVWLSTCFKLFEIRTIRADCSNWLACWHGLYFGGAYYRSVITVRYNSAAIHFTILPPTLILAGLRSPPPDSVLALAFYSVYVFGVVHKSG